MRIVMGQFSEPSHEWLTYAQQLGVGGVCIHVPPLPGDGRWELEGLQACREKVEAYGLRLESLENTPWSFYDKAVLGLPGRDQQIENYQATIRNMGAAGIPVLGLYWNSIAANSIWRTSMAPEGRGGSVVSGFNMDLVKAGELIHGVEVSDDQMWSNFEYFVKAVVPVAEEAGVRLALHPDDPPVPSLGGIARIFGSFDGFRRGVTEVIDSPNLGLNFCMGTWSEMGPGVVEAIRYFGLRGKIVYLHMRDVQGHVPDFRECFLGEGNVDVVEVMRTLKEVGFDGCIEDDHVPLMQDDTSWGHRGRAYSTGYIAGLLAAVEHEG